MRSLRFAITVMTLAAGFASTASAQYYPGGMGRYGWGGWGRNIVSNPNASYMAGLGSFYRAQGDYEIKQQQANSLQIDNMVKWNKAVRQAKAVAAREQAEKDARNAVVAEAEARQAKIADGTTLNEQLAQILDFHASGTMQSLREKPLSADSFKAINFAGDTLPVSLGLDRLTSDDSWPASLKSGDLAEERAAYEAAVDAVIEADKSGKASDEVRDKLDKALEALREKFKKVTPELRDDYSDCDEYLRTLGALNRVIETPTGGQVVAAIESFPGGTLADLVGFMHAFNLKFAPAETDAEKAVYAQLYESFASVPTDAKTGDPLGSLPIDRASEELGSAARDVFKSLQWSDLEKANSK